MENVGRTVLSIYKLPTTAEQNVEQMGIKQIKFVYLFNILLTLNIFI